MDRVDVGLQQLEYWELNVKVSVFADVKLRRLIVLLPSVAMVLLGRLSPSATSERVNCDPLSIIFFGCEECLKIDMHGAKVGW